MASNFACRHCGRAEPTITCVPLWDEHPYCRDCVESACPGLFEFARGHSSLEERVDTATLGSLRQPLTWWVRKAIKPALIVAVGIVLMVTGDKLVGIVACLLGVISGVIWSRLLWKSRHQVRPDASEPLRVSARNGGVEIHRGDRQLVNAPLTEWRWWHVAGGTKSLSRRAPIERLVLLEAPKSVVDAQYVCGSTPEMRERWIGFLKLANVPRISSRLW